jgi:uncharacterized protein YPO0396
MTISPQVTGSLFESDALINSPSAFLLQQLEVFNWGPFEGLRSADFDPQGTAIIGATGSGKTTLIDALMTLITAQPKYNLASTGGHESDRDLVSYIRGVSGAGNDTGDNQHIARPDKTITAIHACFFNGQQQVHIAALFSFEGTSSTYDDLKRLWFFVEDADWSLEYWLSLYHQGGTAAVKSAVKDINGVKLFDKNKKAYLAQVRRFFEVGENAFTLLNRAAGLKQLNSIDDIFRELVLDDFSAFERAAEVANEFDDLADIHNELEFARKQQQSLLPIAVTYTEYQSCETQLSDQQQLLHILPIWFALQAHRMLGESAQTLELQTSELSQQISAASNQIKHRQNRATILKDIYLQAGGAGVEQLKEQIQTQQRLSHQLQHNANDYRRLVKALGMDDDLSWSSFSANQAQVIHQQSLLTASLKEATDQRNQLSAALVLRQNQLAEVIAELTSMRTKTSNIEGKFQDFRADLAHALGLPVELLPFVAELVEVKPDEQAWRGAIERAIGSERLRILVPSEQLDAALDWVNDRNNRLHVRLKKVENKSVSAQFFEDGFTRKLNFKEHPHREALKALLAAMDRHCVDSPKALATLPHGMTREGLMSGKSASFEKQDQKPLSADWMTGFDNKDRVAKLTQEQQQLEQAKEVDQRAYNNAEQAVKNLESQLQSLEKLAGLTFEQIDINSVQEQLNRLQEQLELLTNPDSKVEQARRDYQTIEDELHQLERDCRELERENAKLEERLLNVQAKRKKAFARIGDGLTDTQQTLAFSQLKTSENIAADDLEELERTERIRLDTAREKLAGRIKTLSTTLTKQMGAAKNLDTGALAETGQDLRDIPDYLERLRLLTEEALPQKLKRFLDYLNTSSDQGVSQLLQGIDHEVARIEERIIDLNNTLRRVDFQQGHYLQLAPQRVVHESLRTLQSAQRHLRSAALADDQGESHFKALQNLVNILRDASDTKRRTLGAKALLDPRYRLQFAVWVCERESGVVIEKRTGSQGGSGGEKEIIASYILTASLSYALCPDGAARPLFATIVLDEAFSKSSQAVAGRIVSALREFGLHPLFVTPNKEMRFLRAHTRSAILVHRKGAKATLTPITWEELEAHAHQKMQSRDSPATAL